MKKILIADDHRHITSILEEHSKKEGYTPVSAFDGQDAIRKFEKERPDVVLLDVMMPFKSGFEVCRDIRKTSNVPILMITARSEDFDKIMGLDVGADDYIVKPFSPDEIMARIRAIMRRLDRTDLTHAVFECDGLKIDLNEYSVLIDRANIDLTKREFEILWTLVTNKNKVFSRDNLLDSLWGYDYYGDNRTVDKHINRLRIKLEEIGGKRFTIKTIRGVGYRFEVASDEK